MNVWDIAIILFYLLAIFIVGFIVGRKENLDDYFVNRRRSRFILLIFTVVSTSAGAGTLVGIASAGYSSGISFGLTAIVATALGFFFAALFAYKIKEFGDKHDAYSLGDFFAVRYSSNTRYLVAFIILLAYLFFTSAQYLGVSVLLQLLTGIGLKASLLFAAGGMILYTAFAGIKSDFYTDAIHFVVMFIALVLVALPIILFSNDIIRPILELPLSFFAPFSFAGPVFFFGSLIFGIPFLLVSMEVWQRIYAASDKQTARKTMLWSAILNIPFFISGMFLGLFAKAHLESTIEVADQAIFVSMIHVLPAGLLGIGLAGVIAALLSTANSMIMVSSTTLFKDFYIPIKSKISLTFSDLTAARIITLIVGVLGLLLAILIPNVVQQILNGYYVILILIPAVIGGFLWKRASSSAAFLSILVGFIITIVLLPFIPRMAFIPGVFISALLFILISLFRKREETEFLR